MFEMSAGDQKNARGWHPGRFSFSLQQ